MELAKKLQDARRSRGLSQEALAETMGVSRQAVAKWESGQSVPEVGTLVALSEFYRTSLDRLVKNRSDEACAPGGPVGNPGIPDAVTAFLIRAKRATYAGKGAETTPSRTGSHDLRYQEGNLGYYDTYLGGAAFAGEEALWDEETPFWAMNYVGRVVGDGFSGDFLKECLALVPADRPFRGPSLHQNGDFVYHCAVEGDFSWFVGQEEIFCRGQLVYECRFHGGTCQG